jgi:hypothetical protein
MTGTTDAREAHEMAVATRVTKKREKPDRTATTKKKPATRTRKVAAGPAPEPVAKPETVLVMRSCDKDMKAHGGFVWPRSGPVECPDWQPTKECGHGLHGLLWGEGDAGLISWNADAVWMVVEVAAADIIDLGGKVKFPRGNVIFCGDRFAVGAYMSARAPGKKVHSGTATAGYSGTATAGYSGTATAGDRGTATAGDRGTATAGDSGTATAGDSGTATAGYRGTATAGDRGTATAAKLGYALAGMGGKTRVAENGCIAIRWYCNKSTRWRMTVGYVGENGIKANQWYCLDAAGQFIECEGPK